MWPYIITYNTYLLPYIEATFDLKIMFFSSNFSSNTIHASSCCPYIHTSGSRHSPSNWYSLGALLATCRTELILAAKTDSGGIESRVETITNERGSGIMRKDADYFSVWESEADAGPQPWKLEGGLLLWIHYEQWLLLLVHSWDCRWNEARCVCVCRCVCEAWVIPWLKLSREFPV